MIMSNIQLHLFREAVCFFVLKFLNKITTIYERQIVLTANKAVIFVKAAS